MDIIGKYIDVLTGEIIGFRYQNKEFCVIVSETKAKELDLEDSDIAEYLELPLIQCCKYGDKIYILGYETLDLLNRYCLDKEKLKDVFYRRELLDKYAELDYNGVYDEDDEKVLLLGYLFDKYSGVSIDDETAIRRFLSGSEECM